MFRRGWFGVSAGMLCMLGLAAFACGAERDFGDDSSAVGGGGQGGMGGAGLCRAGEHVSSAGSTGAESECVKCASGTYSTGPSATSCKQWTECSWEKGGLAEPGTKTSDAVCGVPSTYRQFGSVDPDSASGVVVDETGHVFVVGTTDGVLSRVTQGGSDAYLREYAPDGTVLRTEQFGTEGDDTANALAVDGDGDVYVGGSTSGALKGTNAGRTDAYVRRATAQGDIVWTLQFGTDGDDSVLGLTVDSSGNVYVVGQTFGALAGTNAGAADVYLRKYASDGTALWTEQFGTGGGDVVRAIVLDEKAASLYVVGDTRGALAAENAGNSDVFLRKLTLNGDEAWTSQFGTEAYDRAYAVALDGNGNVYIAGSTGGVLSGADAGSTDAFVRKYGSDGSVAWTQQFGTAGIDSCYALTVDSNGNAYVAGSTEGQLSGASAGATDAFVRSFAPDGSILWTGQFGTDTDDTVAGAAMDDNDNLYVVGSTTGVLASRNAGAADVFVRQIPR